MTTVQAIHAYWASNATLTALVPTEDFYTGQVPEKTLFPYVVLVDIGSDEPEYNTSNKWFQIDNFQFSIFADTGVQGETIAEAVTKQFNWKKIDAETIYCKQRKRQFIVEPAGTAHIALDFEIARQFTLA